jgi:hypothetical protein
MSNYIIVLFKNKIKKKIIKKFKTLDNAKKFYNTLLEKSDSVIFNMETENGKPCVYEIGFLEKNVTTPSYYVKDDFGRQIKIELEDPDYSLTKLSKYKKEELIFDVSKSKRVSVQYLIKQYLPKLGIKLVSKINNKIVIQNNSEINLFSLKTEGDTNRLMDGLSSYLLSKGRIDCILVKDSSKEQKKYLYDLLNDAGYSKSVLYRRFTTYKRF